MTTTVPLGVAELTEITACTDFATGAPASVREALGLGTLHAGPTRALAVVRAGFEPMYDRTDWLWHA